MFGFKAGALLLWGMSALTAVLYMRDIVVSVFFKAVLFVGEYEIREKGRAEYIILRHKR